MSSPYVAHGRRARAPVPQSAPLPGCESEMAANNAGGFAFKADDWTRLERFLILGTDGGTYYVGEAKLTAENAAVVIRCVKQHGRRVVDMALGINVENRAPKVEPQLFALALALVHGNGSTRSAVDIAAPSMLRTGTHLLHFAAMLDSMGGWNRSKRRVVGEWFERKTADQLAFQLVKYQQRDGWHMRDALRVAHPKVEGASANAVLRWTTKGVDSFSEDHLAVLPPLVHAHIAAHTEGVLSAKERALAGIAAKLPREGLPTDALADPDVLRALIPETPPHATLRSLGAWTAAGAFADKRALDAAVGTLRDVRRMAKARVHPFAILLASLVYRQGRGVLGSKTWVPERAIIDALDDAYEAAFAYTEPTGKRALVAIDVSSSMHKACVGSPISCATAAAAMALTLARLEPHFSVVNFDTEVVRFVNVTKRSSVSSLINTTGGGTDVTAAVRWATGRDLPGPRFMVHVRPSAQLAPMRTELDGFVILTDDETWAGSSHMAGAGQALDIYRREVSQRAKLVCCSFAANHVQTIDPADPLQFGCAGLDANLPALVTDFLR